MSWSRGKRGEGFSPRDDPDCDFPEARMYERGYEVDIFLKPEIAIKASPIGPNWDQARAVRLLRR